MKELTLEAVNELRDKGYGLLEARSMLKKQYAQEALLSVRMYWGCNEPDLAFKELLSIIEYLLEK